MRVESIYAAEAERLRQGLNEWADEGRLPPERSAALAELVRTRWGRTHAGTGPAAGLESSGLVEVDAAVRCEAERALATDTEQVVAVPQVKLVGTAQRAPGRRRRVNLLAGVAAAAALLLLPLAWPPARAWAVDTFPAIATFLGLRAQEDPGWAWALEHEGFQEVLAQAEGRGYTFRVHRVLADPTQTSIVFTIAGPNPAEPDFWAGETDGFWFNGELFGTSLSVDGEIVDGVYVGVVETDPLPAESGTLRINLNAIGDVQGHWVVEFPVTRQALTAVSRTVPVGQPIGPTEAGLQVEEVVILPTRTEVRVIWTGRTAPWQPVPEFRDVELRVDSGQVVPFQGRMWGDGQGDPEGNGWFRWRIGFDPLPADAKAITVHLNRVDVVSPHERLALPLVEGAAVELPGLPKVTVRTVEPGRATVEWEQDFDDVLPYQNWMLVDVFGNLHAVASQGASGTPGERQTMTATITWEDLPSGNKAAGLEARWVWRTYEGDWQVEVPLE